MPNYQVVISRYEEDVNWARQLGMPVIIYNKGKSPTGLEGEFPVIVHENVGREAETFLHYIVENYDSLSDYTILLQGNPFEHCRTVVDIVRSLRDPGVVIPLSTNWKREVVGSYDWEGFEECVRGLVDYVGISYLTTVNYSTGAEYVVPRHAILTRSKAFYEGLLEKTNKGVNPFEAWALERLWGYMFGVGNKTDALKLDILIIPKSSKAVDEPFASRVSRAVEVARELHPTLECSLYEVNSPESVKKHLIANEQDFVCFVDEGESFDANIFSELIDSYYLFKMKNLKEDDLILGIRPRATPAVSENTVLVGTLRDWSKTPAVSRSFFTNRSVLLQYWISSGGESDALDPGVLAARGVPSFAPTTTLI